MSTVVQPQLKLINEWKQYLRSCAESNKICDEGNKIYVECDKLYSVGDKLDAEGSKLFAEGNKFYAEGNKLFADARTAWLNAVIETYGENVTVEWKMHENGEFDCLLGNGDIYTVEMGRQ